MRDEGIANKPNEKIRLKGKERRDMPHHMAEAGHIRKVGRGSNTNLPLNIDNRKRVWYNEIGDDDEEIRDK